MGECTYKHLKEMLKELESKGLTDESIMYICCYETLSIKDSEYFIDINQNKIERYRGKHD